MTVATETPAEGDTDTQSPDDAAQLDIFNMSDADFANYQLPDDGAPADDDDKGTTDTAKVDENANPDEVAGEETDPEAEGTEGDAGKENEADGGDPTPEGEEGEADAGTEGEEDSQLSPEDAAKKAQTEALAALALIQSPLMANGGEVTITEAEDIRRLMQKGLGYEKSQAAIKPQLKIIKLLTNNGLLDEQKLAHLIQVSKNNPDAIAKVLKDSGLNPIDIDIKKESYQPEVETVTDSDVELDAVFSELKSSPSFDNMIKTVGDDWDDASREAVQNHPSILKHVNDHMNQGIYDKISAEVAKERSLDRLHGMSFIQAYDKVGTAMTQRGDFKEPAESDQAQADADAKTTAAKEAKVKSDALKAKIDKQRKAASAGKATPAKKLDEAAIPKLFDLGDDDFLAQADKLFAV